MNESKMDNLLKRLKRLEQDNRSLKILGSLVVIVLSVVLLMGATQSKQSEIIEVIRARQFTLEIRMELPVLEWAFCLMAPPSYLSSTMTGHCAQVCGYLQTVPRG
ncbi:MAG: hypothetical protein IH919_09235 [Deltaproteobacteria bacterium]|nr:hypothetical protein [Deltaproteobacteria bacterium]